MQVIKDVALVTYTTALPIVLGYIVWLLKESKKYRDANSRGTMMLLKIKLIEYHDRYCPLGYIPSYVYENCKEIHDAYKALDGNGLGDHMWEEIDRLEIRKGVVVYEEQNQI